MSDEIVIQHPLIFSGYSHLGECLGFCCIPGHNGQPVRFVMRGLRCDYDLEELMIRKDLFLRTGDGEEFVLKGFQLTDVSDSHNIQGEAEEFSRAKDSFPEEKLSPSGGKSLISKPTQILAFKAVSSLINSVKTKDGIDEKSTNLVVDQLVADIMKAPDAIMNLIAAKSFDDYTFSHNINVATISLLIGHSMNLARDDLHALGIGALLHDIGKLKIPLNILQKRELLTSGELDEIRRHPFLGFQLLEKAREINPKSKEIVLLHHEKFRGHGYPHGHHGKEIPLLARVVAIADVYDAMTTDRPYRLARKPYDSIKFLLSAVEQHFDPEILGVFLRKISLYPPGSIVILNDRSLGVVLRTNPGAILCPVIRVLRDPGNRPVADGREIDISREKGIFILGPGGK